MIQIITPEGHTEYLYTLAEVAKVLSIKDEKGKLIGRNKFIKILRHNKILCKDNTPSQYWLGMNLMVYRQTTKKWKSYYHTVFTDKGVNYLRNKIANGTLEIYFYKEYKCNTNIKQLNEII